MFGTKSRHLTVAKQNKQTNKKQKQQQKLDHVCWAILCPAVCISDVINKAGMCGILMNYYVTSQPFLLVIGKARTDMAAPSGTPTGNKRELLLI